MGRVEEGYAGGGEEKGGKERTRGGEDWEGNDGEGNRCLITCHILGPAGRILPIIQSGRDKECMKRVRTPRATTARQARVGFPSFLFVYHVMQCGSRCPPRHSVRHRLHSLRMIHRVTSHHITSPCKPSLTYLRTPTGSACPAKFGPGVHGRKHG